MRKTMFALLRYLPDKAYLQLMYYYHFGKFISWKHPETFNEKIQWLKVYDRNPLYTTFVDKIEVKDYVSNKIGSEYIIPTLGVWDSFDEIDFDKLPNQFVLKTNHSGGNSGVIICTDKTNFDKESARIKLTESLNTDVYLYGREWPYKNVRRRILAEEYMVDESGFELKDYKFFCFNGKPQLMFIASDRQVEGEDTKFDFFDMDFNHLPFTNGHPNANRPIKCPKSFEQMKELASRLSEGVPQVRVDFYDINGQVYFGELTLSHWSGMVPFVPNEWDKKIGDMIVLPSK